MTNVNNNLALKRLLAEFRKLNRQPETEFVAAPCKDDLFVWHFTIKGQKGTPFEGGIYHGKIVFPAQYPSTPPDIYFLTPNGRFETNTKICFSITSFHPDTWSPAWDVRTALLSIIAFMPTKSNGAIGGIDETDEVRRDLAIKSRSWKCEECSLTIEPDDIPNSCDENKENENGNKVNEKLEIKDNESDNKPQVNDIVNETFQEEEKYDHSKIIGTGDKVNDNDIEINLNQESNDDNKNDNIIHDTIEKEEQEEFDEDLLNINVEELYNIPEIHQDNIDNENNLFYAKSSNSEEETHLQMVKITDYKDLSDSAKNDKPFVFFPYLEIPIFIIFCILLIYSYKFHSS